jgi:hypothetical protein
MPKAGECALVGGCRYCRVVGRGRPDASSRSKRTVDIKHSGRSGIGGAFRCGWRVNSLPGCAVRATSVVNLCKARKPSASADLGVVSGRTDRRGPYRDHVPELPPLASPRLAVVRPQSGGARGPALRLPGLSAATRPGPAVLPRGASPRCHRSPATRPTPSPALRNTTWTPFATDGDSGTRHGGVGFDPRALRLWAPIAPRTRYGLWADSPDHPDTKGG